MPRGERPARHPRSGRTRSAAAPRPRWRWSRSGRGRAPRSGSSGAGSPLGTSPTSATPCAPRSNSARGQQPACHEHQRTGNRGRQATQSEDHRERRDAHEQGRPVRVAKRSQPRPELAPRVVTLGRRPGQLGQLADDDVDRRPREEPGDHRLRQEARDPPHPQEREQQEQQSRGQRDRRDELAPPAPRRRWTPPPRRPPRPQATSSAPSRCAGTCRRARR